MKVTIFLIFWDFSKMFFKICYLFLIKSNKQSDFISHTDMAANVVGVIMCCHVGTYVHATRCKHVLVFACVRLCVCARVGTCGRMCN